MLEYIRTNIDPLEALNMAYTIYKFPSLEMEQLQMPIVALSETRNYKDLGSVFLMDRLQNASILYNFIYENIYPNEEEFDYDSLQIELQKYADQEAIYNQMYDINPDDYIEIQDGEIEKSDTSIVVPEEPIYIPEEPIYVPEEDSWDDSGQVPPNEDSGEVANPPVPEKPEESNGESDGSGNGENEDQETGVNINEN